MSDTVRLGLILPELPENLYGDQGYNPLLTRTGYLRRVKYWLPAFLGVIVLLTTMGCPERQRERILQGEPPAGRPVPNDTRARVPIGSGRIAKRSLIPVPKSASD